MRVITSWVVSSMVYVILMLAASTVCADTRPSAGLLAVGTSAEKASISQALRWAGYSIFALSYDDLCDSSKLQHLDLLVLPDSSTLPVGSVKSISAYIDNGGRIMALRAPMWRTLLVKSGDRWITQDDYREEACREPRSGNTIVDWSRPGVMESWQRSTGNVESKAISIVTDGGKQVRGSVLTVNIDKVTNWETLSSPDIEGAFPAGHSITVFCAKGSRNTDKLSVEWMEKNGRRWIAVVQLTDKWQQYVLMPEDFRRWYTGNSSDAITDPFKLENASKLSVGLSFSHTGRNAGPHEYSISSITTAPADPEYLAMYAHPDIPAFDTLSPEYKFFNMTGTKYLSTRQDQRIVAPSNLPVPKSLLSGFPRAKGAGLDKGRDWRWIPIVNGSVDGEMRGTPVTLMVRSDGKRKGGMWASFGIQDRDWYQTPNALSVIRQMAAKMRNGVFILEGGADHYTYFADQPVKLGAKVANYSDTTRTLRVLVSLTGSGNRNAFHREKAWTITLEPGETRTVSDLWGTGSTLPPGCRVTVFLMDDRNVIDRIYHDVSVWQPAETKEWVTVKDGKFMLGGKRWRVHGVNYWPIYTMASEDPILGSRLFSKAAYDPEMIERDLRIIEGMGLNAVATALMMDEADSQNVIDFLRRCRNHNIKVMLHLGMYLSPMDDDWPKVLDMLKRCRISDNDALFAYDLCWELGYGMYSQRKRWDRDWEEWVIERYGSIGNAESDWGRPIPRDDKGQVTSPGDADVSNRQESVRMVAAYRRFLDTLTYRRYSKAHDMMKQVDPNHLVSFRMTESGNPTWRADGMCYDFPYFPGGVDFLGPEGWGRIGDWDFVKHAMFEKPYAKWAAPGLPVVFTEVGVSQLMGTGDWKPTRELIDTQAKYHSDWYRVLLSGSADGMFWWWYPGGYRFGEGSDYGIINPDGSDRPVTKIIRQNAQKFIDGPDMKAPDHMIEFDRTETAGFPANMYDRIKDEFWQTIDSGKTPGFRTKGTGTTSADCPLIAVGGSPCNGSNPPEYLDGAFDKVEIMGEDGKWMPVTRGGDVMVSAGRPVTARVTVTNLGEAKWLSGVGAGTVQVIASGGASTALPRPVARHNSVDLRGITLSKTGVHTPTDITLTFDAQTRTPFGEKFKFRLVPR
ncbi:MAG: glycoside hydrolase 5 family protein [Armatimonadota bacterium]